MATGSARRKRAAAASGRGGHREGQPGKAYSQRKDLIAPSAGYGQRAAQERSVAAVPLPAQAPPPAPASGGGAGAPAQGLPAGPPPVQPGGLGPLNAPTQRPNQPLTAGLPTGPGPGPEVLGMAPNDTDPVIHVLRGILSRYPNPDIAALLAQAQGR